jgi:mannose-6-phosphate isomerase-like protein (cupin superfamily)
VLIKKLTDCREIVAGDRTRLRELLHPDRDEVRIRYSLAVARLEPGRSSMPHRLKTAEVYYLVRGSGVMHVGAEARRVETGDAVYIPPDSVQRLENTGKEEIEFLCIVDPAWRAEDETRAPAGPVI